MSMDHHDHPASPGGVSPEDLDLYALHALPEPEAEAVESALVAAPAQERSSMLAHIASTREAAAQLVAGADLDVSPPPALRDRVLQLVADQAPAPLDRAPGLSPGRIGPRDPADEESGGGADVVDLDAKRRRRRPLLFLTAAVAAIALLMGGVALGRLTDGTGGQDSLPVAAPPEQTMPGDVASMLAAEDLAVVRGSIADSGTATILASKSEDMAVLSMTDLPDPAEGRAYQLWLMGDHEPISAGTMESGQVGPAPTARIEGIRSSDQIGITEEPAGGSAAPTGQVLLALDLT